MDKYTKFILTVIAVALIGILFKSELNNPAHANWSAIWSVAKENNALLHRLINMH